MSAILNKWRVPMPLDHTIAERRNDCCETGGVYVLFLRERGGIFQFVGSPLGAIPVQLARPPNANLS